MAASVEGTFILLDRASGPARRIKGELRELELQAQRTGKAMDDSIGTPRQLRTMDQTERELRAVRTSATGVSGEMRELGQQSTHAERRVRSLGSAVRTAGITLAAFGKIVNVLKWPALIAGAGAATQAIAGLGGAAVAAMPALTDLGGAAIGLVPIYVGLGAAVGTTALAMGGLKEAAGGNREALKRLTPEARAFLEVLKQQRRMVTGIRRESQRGLFPGLTDALSLAPRAQHTMRKIARQQGEAVGDLAWSGAQKFTDPQVLRQMETLSAQSSRAFGGAARGGMDLAIALVEVTTAAEPFTDWMTNAIEDMAELVREEARVGRQTGELEAYFDRTRRRLQQFGRIGEDVFHTVGNVMDSARDAGDDLWRSIERGADRMEKWTGSTEGQLEMRRFFEEIKPVAKETAGLVGDIAGAFIEIGRSQGGAAMLRELRGAVPEITDAVSELTGGFGPTMVRTLTDVIELLAELAGHGGPLRLMAETLGLAARATTDLVDALGPLGDALILGLGASMLMRRIRLLGDLKDAIVGVGRASKSAAPAVAVPGGVTGGGVPVAGGAGGAARGGAVMPMGVVMPAGGGGAAGAVPRGVAMSPGGVILPAGGPAARAAVPAATGGQSLAARGRAGLARGYGWARTPGSARAFGGGAARMGGPTLLLMGLMQGAATQGDFAQRAQGFGSGVTLGMIPRPIAGDEKAQAGGAWAQKIIGARTGDLDENTRAGQQEAIRRLEGIRPRAMDSFDQGEKDAGTAEQVLKQELTIRRRVLRDQLKAERQEVKDHVVKEANALTVDFGKAFDIRAQRVGPVKAMDKTVDNVLERMHRMKPAGVKVVGENMLAWARQQAKGNPKMEAEVEELERGIVRRYRAMGRRVEIVNGRILTGTKSEWKNIRTALTTETEKARQEATSDFTAIQRQAIGSLKAMGFSGPRAEALMKGMEAGGARGKKAEADIASPGGRSSLVDPIGTAAHPTKKRARGGPIPGMGRQDTVHLGAGHFGAPNEWIVNDHSRRDINALLAEKGLSLEKIVSGEYKRHSDPPGSRPRRGKTPHDVPAFLMHAKGGIVPVPGFPGEMAATSILDEIAYYTSTYGLRLTDAYGQGHQSPGHTRYGTAADLAGPDKSMDRAVQALVAAGYKTLYDGRFGSIKWPGHGPSNVAGGNAHIHVEFGGKSGLAPDIMGTVGGAMVAGGMAQQMPELKAPGTNLGGAPGALVKRSNEVLAKGLTQQVNDRLTALGGVGMPTGAGGAAPSGQVREWLTQALQITGHYSEANLNALYSRAMQESGGNPNAINRWDSNAKAGHPSQGLLQTIPGTFNAYRDPSVPGGITDPIANAVAAIRYMFGRYGHIVGANGRGYTFGGALPVMGGDGGSIADWGGWNALGADRVVKRPTLFGAGERGPERVQITPAGGRRGGGRQVTATIERGAVVVHAGGADADAVGRIVESKLEQFADMIEEELGAGDEEDTYG